jgi:hypothetical protein
MGGSVKGKDGGLNEEGDSGHNERTCEIERKPRTRKMREQNKNWTGRRNDEE